MRLTYLFIFIASITFNALSLEIFINDYNDVDYDSITTYNLRDDSNDCTCYESQKNYYGQDKSSWW
jgi:hypothetical protein